MDELVKMVADKTGISNEQARMAVDIVVDFIKQKMPGSTGEQLAALLEGGNPADLLGSLGGLFGGK
ncbi:MAG TPA: hypothetical protein EYP88_03910 [Anaerolineales bacterium]|nr:hypothetical protein [Anaerolineales bacterium]